jgi:hypothetical protein
LGSEKWNTCFGIIIYKLCDMSGCTYDTDIYLGKDRTDVTADMTVAHTTVKQLTEDIKGHEHKLYMGCFFFLHGLFSDLTKKKIDCYGTVGSKRRECQRTELAACFLLVSCLIYPSSMKMEAILSSQMSMNFF